ncbi:MAG: type II toxin-antitoxin system HicA family toxin [Candidatus Korarchaeota archaeon]|nr:type II toxin-antitoxin system HicA family toxin [Candidatus Korarchaeota archaeon]
MPKITPIDPYKLIKILSKLGFKPIRQRGSHVILVNEQHVRIVVPVHPGKKLKPGLIRVIMAEAGLTREKYFELLERDC